VVENQAVVVIVDSIASLARKEFPPYKPGKGTEAWKRIYLMAGWVARLKTLASNRNLAVRFTE